MVSPVAKFACGSWLQQAEIPAHRSAVSRTFTQISDAVTDVVGVAVNATHTGKLADYFGSCMNEDAIDAQGLAPISPMLARIQRIASVDELVAANGELRRHAVNAFFSVEVEVDPVDVDKHIVAIGQDGLTMTSLQHYLGAKNLVNEYKALVFDMMSTALSSSAAASKGSSCLLK